MSDPENIKMSEIFGSLTTKQLWAACSAVVALLAGSFMLGHTISSISANAKSAEVNARHISSQSDQRNAHTAKLENLKEELNLAKESVDQANEMAANMASKANGLGLKSTFLDHMLRYEMAEPSSESDHERAENLLANFVHRMWQRQEENAVELAYENQDITNRVRVRVLPNVSRNPLITKPTYKWEDRTTTQRVIKVVSFPDGARYEVPSSVAKIVHLRQ